MYHEISASMLANLAEWGDRLRVPGKHTPRAKTASEAVAPKNGGPTPRAWDEVAQIIFDRLHVAASGCWEWTGARHRQGYGTIRINEVKFVHIITYVMFNGIFATKLEVCHSCNNPPCANPEHLYLGTHLQNMRDANRDGLMRRPFGERHYKSKLSEADVISLRERAASGVRLSHLVKEYGMTGVHEAVRGRSWKHLPMPPALAQRYPSKL